jgi:hypothetical protein
MEFFAIAAAPIAVSDLHKHIRVDTLADLCASIDKVISHEGNRGEIYCVWGEFRVHREMLRDGVRFTLPGCRNGVQWTITADNREKTGTVVVHCTINQRQHDADFVESLEQFVADWKHGLEHELARVRAATAPKVGQESMPWFG